LTSDVEVVNFDGERCVPRKEGDAVRLESRTGRTLTGTYPELSVALAGQRLDRFLVDGEVVVFDDGQTSFSRLQQRLGVTSPSPALVDAYPAVYCVFDLLEIDGEDLTARPLIERRARLEQAIRPTENLLISAAWRNES
jgi:bifunctional non-homologous end joining protein LigD